jgi:predicted type IV restriction endonuclease
MTINEVVTRIRGLKGIESYNEATTSQTIILQVLQVLQWSIFDNEEVIPQYSVEERKVDYCLRCNGKNLLFLEAKRASEKLDQHEEYERQLLDYAYYEGVKLAILTNGITWWFYLPMIGENWRTRKFLAIDIKEQEPELVSTRFTELLGKENVSSGKALAQAEEIHQSRKRQESIRQALPEAWNEVIGEPKQELVDLLLNATERICGFRPTPADVTGFLKENKDSILLEVFDTPAASSTVPEKGNLPPISQQDHAGRGGGRISVMLDSKQFEGSSIATLYFNVLKYVVDSGRITKATLPWGTGSKRYFIYKGDNPAHMNGRPFFQPVSYMNYHLESHVRRSQGVRFLGAFCNMLGYDFKVLEIENQ